MNLIYTLVLMQSAFVLSTFAVPNPLPGSGKSKAFITSTVFIEFINIPDTIVVRDPAIIYSQNLSVS
jgi:hypothetical protein